MRELTAKQLRFVAEYLVDGNGARAAMAAGYGRAGAKVTAHRLTHANPAVQAAIAARQDEDACRLEIERHTVIQGLLRAIEQARVQSNPAAMIAGWREVGRLLGLYQPDRHVVQVGSVGGERARLERLTDVELNALLS